MMTTEEVGWLIACTIILYWVGIASLVSWVAMEKGRAEEWLSVWFVLGAIFGPMAMLAIGFAPGVHDEGI